MTTSHTSLGPLVLLVAGLSAACTAPVLGDADFGDEGNQERASSAAAIIEVHVETSSLPDNDGQSAGDLALEARARFVTSFGKQPSGKAPKLPQDSKQDGQIHDALSMLGLTWESAPVAGGCERSTPTRVGSRQSTQSSARVDLADRSPVTLTIRPSALFENAQTPEQVPVPVALEPRVFPNILGQVSGVVHESPRQVLAHRDQQFLTVALHVTGRSVGQFPMPTSANAWKAFVHGQEISRTKDQLQLQSLNQLQLRLDKPALKQPDSRPYDERWLAYVQTSSGTTLRCAFDTVGQLVIPLDELENAEQLGLTTMVQRRYVDFDANLGQLDVRLDRASSWQIVVKP